MDRSFLIVLTGWFLPGGGYFLQNRWRRGLVVGGIIWLMFLIAILGGGAYYPGLKFDEGALLYLLNIFARLGIGLGAVISYGLGANPPPDAAGIATFEYAGRFLEVAGLLNYLAVIDAADVFGGRKE